VAQGIVEERVRKGLILQGLTADSRFDGGV